VWRGTVAQLRLVLAEVKLVWVAWIRAWAKKDWCFGTTASWSQSSSRKIERVSCGRKELAHRSIS
jgi:hypothetical protein